MPLAKGQSAAELRVALTLFSLTDLNVKPHRGKYATNTNP
jgi:hypothetical protein